MENTQTVLETKANRDRVIIRTSMIESLTNVLKLSCENCEF
ncbi:MAG: hypothetical protein QM793_08670 [Muricomes sp.]